MPVVPNAKQELLIAVTAGLVDGGLAMGQNVYEQYDALREQQPHATVEHLFGQIDWQQAITEGGVSFAITRIATGVVIYAKDNPRFINFAQKLKIEADGIESLSFFCYIRSTQNRWFGPLIGPCYEKIYYHRRLDCCRRTAVFHDIFRSEERDFCYAIGPGIPVDYSKADKR